MRLSLNGTIIVGRDIAHAKLKKEQWMDSDEGLPQYIKRSSYIYYAGPAKRRKGTPRVAWADYRRTDGLLC